MPRGSTQDAEQILTEAMEILTALGPMIELTVKIRGKVTTIQEMGKTVAQAARERTDEGDEDVINTMAMTIVALIIELTARK